MTSAKIVSFPQQDLDDLPLIPEGEYRLKLVEHETSICFGPRSPRLVLTFTVCDMGQHFGTRLQRFYNVARLKSKAGKKGQFVAKLHGDLMIEICTLLNRKVRPDRVPLEPLYNSVLVGRIQTVKHNSQQKDLPEVLHYSKVAALLKVEQ